MVCRECFRLYFIDNHLQVSSHQLCAAGTRAFVNVAILMCCSGTVAQMSHTVAQMSHTVAQMSQTVAQMSHTVAQMSHTVEAQ